MQGKCDEAIAYLERAVRLSRRVLPPGNPGTAYALAGYGTCLSDLGRPEEGAPMLVEARDIIAKAMGPESETCVQMEKDLAKVYEKWEQAEPGKGHGEKAKELRSKHSPVTSPGK